MSNHEYIFGNVMLGLIAGAFLWALCGALFSFMFRDDLSVFTHHGVRQMMYADVDILY